MLRFILVVLLAATALAATGKARRRPEWFRFYRLYYKNRGMKVRICNNWLAKPRWATNPVTGDACRVGPRIKENYLCLLGQQTCSPTSRLLSNAPSHPTRKCECDIVTKTFTCDTDLPECEGGEVIMPEDEPSDMEQPMPEEEMMPEEEKEMMPEEEDMAPEEPEAEMMPEEEEEMMPEEEEMTPEEPESEMMPEEEEEMMPEEEEMTPEEPESEMMPEEEEEMMPEEEEMTPEEEEMMMMSDMVGGGMISDFTVSETPASESVQYKITFNNNWSGVNHPIDYPADAHWSPPVIASHNMDYTMWETGGTSSPGVQLVAETGSPSILRDELDAAGDVINTVSVGVVTFNRDTQMQTIEGLMIDEEHSMISAITMMAPSPDWCAGFYGMNAIKDGMWLDTFTIVSPPYDMGTDAGMTYRAGNDPVDPFMPIFELTASTVPATGVFLDSAGESVLPVASWTFELV